MDIVDGTPLLDIKPYIAYDRQKVEGIGWLSERAEQVEKKVYCGVPKLNTIRRSKV